MPAPIPRSCLPRFLGHARPSSSVIPALPPLSFRQVFSGNPSGWRYPWIPAFAGMTQGGLGMTQGRATMTQEGRGYDPRGHGHDPGLPRSSPVPLSCPHRLPRSCPLPLPRLHFPPLSFPQVFSGNPPGWRCPWIPAFAGMTQGGLGMTQGRATMSRGYDPRGHGHDPGLPPLLSAPAPSVTPALTSSVMRARGGILRVARTPDGTRGQGDAGRRAGQNRRGSPPA